MKFKILFKLIIVGILFFINQNTFAQKLLLENNVSQTNYKLGYLRHVRISSILDSTHTLGHILVKLKTILYILLVVKKLP